MEKVFSEVLLYLFVAIVAYCKSVNTKLFL